MESLREQLSLKNLTLVNCDEIKDDNYKFNNENSNKIMIKITCGHELKRAISTLFIKGSDIVCRHCKRNEKYGFNEDDSSITCRECNHVNTNCKSTNLGKFKCRACKHNASKFEIDLYNKLTALNFVVSKNYWYNKDNGSLTGDLWFKKDDKTVVIEVDDNNHKNKNLVSHRAKDVIILAQDEVQLIRVFNKDIEVFVQHINDILEMDDKIIVFQASKGSTKLYDSIYSGDFENTVKIKKVD